VCLHFVLSSNSTAKLDLYWLSWGFYHLMKLGCVMKYLKSIHTPSFWLVGSDFLFFIFTITSITFIVIGGA
jgi:hypothetical protein